MTKRRQDSGLRLLSYARVSDVRGREGPGFISEVDQFARNRSYADAYGHTIIEEASDLDVSGEKMSRPTFDRFLAMIAAGDADGLIVAKLDRFARSNVGALAAVEAIERAGGTLISVAEQLGASTGAGRFLRSILFAAAHWERERIGEAWQVARSSAVERGIHIAPRVPPGYVRGPRTSDPATDRRLVPHPVHAETIRDAFRMAAEGASDSAIAAFLTERGLTGSKGRKTHWVSYRVPRLLSNRVYVGEARSGSFVQKDAHEPLIDQDTFALAHWRRAGRDLRRPNRDAKRAPSILSGIVRCASCSFAMKSQEAGRTSPALYRCTRSSVDGRCPSPSVITKAKVEDYVIARFVEEADTRIVASESDDEWRVLAAAVGSAERSYRAALVNTDLRRRIGDADHDALIAALHREWLAKRDEAERARPAAATTLSGETSLRDLVQRLRDERENETLRGLLAEGIEAVFVRPARSRSHNLPASERVHIAWRGAEQLDLPQRGRRFEPRAFNW